MAAHLDRYVWVSAPIGSMRSGVCDQTRPLPSFVRRLRSGMSPAAVRAPCDATPNSEVRK